MEVNGFSSDLNHKLGDDSGRTVCLRTTHGFKKFFNSDMEDLKAEKIVHVVMIVGVASLASVVLWYIMGREA